MTSLAVLAACSLAVSSITQTQPSPAAHVVVARDTGEALVVVNETPLVATLVKAPPAAHEADDRLERAALQALIPRIDLLRRASSVTVRIVYDQSAEVSSAYGDLPSQRVVRYADVTLNATDMAHDRDRWREAVRDGGPLPAWIGLTVRGSLPTVP